MQTNNFTNQGMSVFHKCTTYGGEEGKGILPVFLPSKKYVHDMVIKHSTSPTTESRIDTERLKKTHKGCD